MTEGDTPVGPDEALSAAANAKDAAAKEGPRQERQQTRLSQQPYTVFNKRQRVFIVTFATVVAWFTTLSGNIYFPALSSIAQDLNTSKELISLTVTSYMVFQGLSPPLWSALADVHGRRVAYLSCLLVFIGATAGISQTKHYYQLLVLRCLQSTGSASTLAIGSGVIGDITTRAERGSYMGTFQGMTLLMNAIGPVIGGLLAFQLGWRSIFTFLAIFAGVVLIALLLFLPETLRALVGNGSIPPRGIAMSPIVVWQKKRKERKEKADKENLEMEDPIATKAQRRHIDFIAPFQILVMPHTVFMLAFLSITYSLWQATIVVLSNYFASLYGLNELQIGLCFIANGVGSMAGSLIVGRVMDAEYQKVKSNFNGATEDFPIEKARLRSVYVWAPMSWASLIVFGWTIDKRVYIAVPIIASFWVSMAAVAIQSAVTTLLVDLFPKKSASAAAALNLCRCLCGAGFTAAAIPLCEAIGIGPAFSLFTGLEFLSTIFIIVQIRNGPRWRKKWGEKH